MPLSSRLATPALALGLALSAAAPALATNGPKPTAYGARAAGRGGVDYAYADDATGPTTNPAGMGFTWGNRYDTNWALLFPRVEWTNAHGTFKNEERVFFAVPTYSFGVVLDPGKDWEIAPLFDLGNWGLRREEEREAERAQDPPGEDAGDLEPTDAELYGSRLKIGFGCFPVTGGKIKLADMRTAFAEPVDWETDVISLAITPSFAYRITDYLSVGFALQVLYSQFELDGGIAQDPKVLADQFESAGLLVSPSRHVITIADVDDAKTNFEHNNGSWGLSGRLGLMFNTRLLSIGLMYQERGHTTDYFGRSRVDATDQVNQLTNHNPDLLRVLEPAIDPSRGFVSNYDMRIQDVYFPRMVGLGFAFRPAPWVSLGVDYTWIHWSEAFRKFRARLYNGDNPNLDILTSPTVRVRVPLDYRDQHVIALGASFRVHEGADIVEGVPSWSLVWRCGYNYGSSPVPRQNVLPQQPTIGEHHLSTGFTLHIGPLLELTAAVEWTLPNQVKTPREVDGGHKGDFTLSDSKQEVELIFVQFGLGVNF